MSVVHPRQLTWTLKMMVPNRNLLLQGSIFRCVCREFYGGVIFLFPKVGSVNMLVPWRLKLQEIYLIYTYIYIG